MPRPPLLARAGSRIADVCERWFPDAFVFALAAIVLVFIGGLVAGVKPVTLATEFGNGFWSLVNFTMQMAMVIVGGFVVASSPPVARLTRWLASIPKTARGAVAFVAAFAMLSSLISWGLSLIFTGLLVREIVEAHRRRLSRHRRRRLPRARQRLGARTLVIRGAAAGDEVVDPAVAAADHRRDSADADDLSLAEHGHGGGARDRVGDRRVRSPRRAKAKRGRRR